jgi:hypothetical protein
MIKLDYDGFKVRVGKQMDAMAGFNRTNTPMEVDKIVEECVEKHLSEQGITDVIEELR